jgi:GDP-L-fucose synthase
MKFLNAKNNNKKHVEIWGDGSAKREFLFSDDLANAIHLILKTTKKKLFKLCGNNFPIINVGSGDIYSIKELAAMIAKKINYKGKIIYNINYPNGVMKKDLESSKLNTLGWKPKVRLEQGLEIILKNIKRNSW